MTPQVHAKQLRGTITVARDLTAQGDAEKIEQIVLNLLANATKFTPRGGSIDVTGEMTGDAVTIRIADSGIGVPEDMRDRIFEPFVQLNTTVTSHVGGTGLGLAISRDLARLMDGALEVDTRAGGGSVFTITLPAAPTLDASPARVGAEVETISF